jgi:hypothetical protein
VLKYIKGKLRGADIALDEEEVLVSEARRLEIDDHYGVAKREEFLRKLGPDKP